MTVAKQPAQSSLLMTMKQVMGALQLSDDGVHSLRRSGLIKGAKVGTHATSPWRFSRRSVEQYVSSIERKAGL